MRWIILLFSFCLCPPLYANTRIVVLDVGEGQAILLKHRAEGILIDTGHPGMSVSILQRLKYHQVEKLAFIILTHLHADHAGGYFRFREAFPEAMVLHNGHPLPENIEPDLVRWVNNALKTDRRQQKIMAGDKLRWHDFTLRFLWPFRFSDNNLNRHSLVIHVRFHDITALLMGDADRFVEQSLMKSGVLTPVQLLVAGHHGASDTGDKNFLEHLSPDYAVISVNRNNIRGYPNQSTVATLKTVSDYLLRTDQDGEICFQLHSDHPLQQCHSAAQSER